MLFALPSVAERSGAPFFPFAVYDKSELPPDSAQRHDYQTRLLNALVQNNINTVVIQPYRNVVTTLKLMDAAQARDVRVIMSVGNPLNPSWDYIDPRNPFFPAYRHPSVIAFKYGDEPDDDADLRVLENAYGALIRHVRAPVFTVIVGEQMRFIEGEIASKAWSRLRVPLRVARFYPLRKSYDLQRWPTDKMNLPFEQWARDMELAADTPWWYVAQAFGQGTAMADASFWRLPTAAETSATLHIALANGARGIIGYALQDHAGRFMGLLDERLEARRARDGTQPLQTWSEVGAIVRAHSALLARHRRGDFIRDATEGIVAVARVDPDTGEEYLYVVNKNTERPSSGVLSIVPSAARAVATNLYAHDSVRATVAPDGTLAVSLAAGQGKLLRLSRD
jgi:hypothetical protein